MITQPDYQQIGEDFLEHFGKKGMKWGHRTGSGWVSKSASSVSKKASSAKKGIKTTYTKVAASKGLANTKQAVKTTAGVAIRIGAAQAFGIIGVVGVVAVTALVKENPELIQSGKDFVSNTFKTTTIDRSGPALLEGHVIVPPRS